MSGVCSYHRDVLEAMSETRRARAAHGRVYDADDEAIAQVARDLSRQCPGCIATEGFTARETTANLAA